MEKSNVPIAGKGSKLNRCPHCGYEGKMDKGIVLDPFSGAGTTALVAKKLGRRYIGIEINPEYVKMAEDRLRNTERSLF